MAIEQYANLGATALTANYTAGSGSITVTATVGSPAFSTAAPFRVVISNGTTIKVILKVTAITDATHFAVTAEGTDANGTSGDNVYQVLTAGGLDGIRAAIQQSGAIASLPSVSPQEGDIYRTTDDVYSYRRAAGSVWEAYGPDNLLVPPSSISFTNFNSPTVTSRTNGSQTISQTGSGGHVIVGRTIPAPSTPYTITAAFLVGVPNRDFNEAGLLWRNSVSGNIVTAALIRNGNDFVGSDKFTSPTVFSANYFLSPCLWRSMIWLRLSDDGTTRTISFSYDGMVWLTAGTSPHADFMTPDQVGWFIDMEIVASGSMTLIHWKQT